MASETWPSPWEFLGLPENSPPSDIRKAYARKLKSLGPSPSAQDFQRLREAMQEALNGSPNPSSPPPVAAGPAQLSPLQTLDLAIDAVLDSAVRNDYTQARAKLSSLATLCESGGWPHRWHAIQRITWAFREVEILPGAFTLDFLRLFQVDDDMAGELGRPPIVERMLAVQDAKQAMDAFVPAGAAHILSASSDPAIEEALAYELLSKPPKFPTRLRAIWMSREGSQSRVFLSVLDRIRSLVTDPASIGFNEAACDWWTWRLEAAAHPWQWRLLFHSATFYLGLWLSLTLPLWQIPALANRDHIAIALGLNMMVSLLLFSIALITEYLTPTATLLLAWRPPRPLAPLSLAAWYLLLHFGKTPSSLVAMTTIGSGLVLFIALPMKLGFDFWGTIWLFNWVGLLAGAALWTEAEGASDGVRHLVYFLSAVLSWEAYRWAALRWRWNGRGLERVGEGKGVAL